MNQIVSMHARKVYVDKSAISGRGVFAKKDVKKGEIIFIAKGTPRHLKVRNKKDSQLGPDWLGVGRDLWIDPYDYNPLSYINHSCEPNAGIKGAVTVVASQNIHHGEEITFDYSTTESDLYWEFRCNCKNKKCRKIIRSVQFLPIERFKRYLPYVPRYFKKVYVEYNGNKYHLKLG